MSEARRAFIREYHPDRGGDPAFFVAGLASFDRVDERPAVVARPVVVTAYRARSLRRRVIRSTRLLRRRLAMRGLS